jgi:hypothetical protein
MRTLWASKATNIALLAAFSFGGSTNTVAFAIAVNLVGLIREKGVYSTA